MPLIVKSLSSGLERLEPAEATPITCRYGDVPCRDCEVIRFAFALAHNITARIRIGSNLFALRMHQCQHQCLYLQPSSGRHQTSPSPSNSMSTTGCDTFPLNSTCHQNLIQPYTTEDRSVCTELIKLTSLCGVIDRIRRKAFKADSSLQCHLLHKSPLTQE